MNDLKVANIEAGTETFLEKWLSEKVDREKKSTKHFRKMGLIPNGVLISTKKRSFTVIESDEVPSTRSRSIPEKGSASMSWVFGTSHTKEALHTDLLRREKKSASTGDIGKVLEETAEEKKKKFFLNVYGEILKTEKVFYFQLRLITRKVGEETIADFLKRNRAISEENYKILKQYEVLAKELRECSKCFISGLRKEGKTEEEKLLEGYSIKTMRQYLDVFSHYVTICEQEKQLFPNMEKDPIYQKRYKEIGNDLQKMTKSQLDLASFFITSTHFDQIRLTSQTSLQFGEIIEFDVYSILFEKNQFFQPHFASRS